MSSLFQILLWTAALSLIAFFLVRHQRLQSIPGPFLASFTDLWRAYRQNFGDFSSILVQLHDKYGSIVRLGPNTVSVSDSAAVAKIYSMHGEFKKADSYQPLQALVNGKTVGTMIDMQDEETNSALKRAVGAAFAATNVLEFEHDAEETANVLVEQILQRRTVNIFGTLQQFQIDFLLKIAFSETPGFLVKNQDVSGMAFEPRHQHWMRWQSMPVLEKLIFKNPYFNIFGEFATPSWALHALTTLKTRKERTGESKTKDLLDKYIDGMDKHRDVLDPDLTLRMVGSTISAGFDTTAFTMTSIIFYLLKNPRTYTKLQRELEVAVAQGQLSSPPKYRETSRLEYLAVVIKEAMRCYPFLTLLLEREIPTGGADVAGTWLPGGTTVGCHASVVQHDRSCYGADADIFRPERWLDADADQRLAMERGMLAFGSGKRMCMGRHIADLEMKKVIPLLLLKFKMSLVDADAKLEPVGHLTSLSKPILVTFEERS